MSYAAARREQYRAEIYAAHAYYRDTRDLPGYQERYAAARDTWHADIREHYRDTAVESAYVDARNTGGRIYADTITGERVSVPTIGALYAVSDVTGAPAEPLIARIVGGFIVSHATVADIIGRA